MKGNRHTEPQRGVSERNRRKAAALSAEMSSLSRSITRFASRLGRRERLLREQDIGKLFRKCRDPSFFKDVIQPS